MRCWLNMTGTIERRLRRAEKLLAATPEAVKAQTSRRVNELLTLARIRRRFALDYASKHGVMLTLEQVMARLKC